MGLDSPRVSTSLSLERLGGIPDFIIELCSGHTDGRPTRFATSTAGYQRIIGHYICEISIYRANENEFNVTYQHGILGNLILSPFRKIPSKSFLCHYYKFKVISLRDKY